MNTQHTVVSLLLAFLAADVTAQQLKLDAVVHPGYIDARVDGAKRGHFTVLVLGLSESRVKLPGGHELGIEPDLIAGFAVADGYDATTIGMRLPGDLHEDFTCFAQAVSFDPELSPTEPKALGLSQVQKLQVAAPR